MTIDTSDHAVPPGFVVLANAAAGSVDERSLGAAVTELATHAPTEVRRTDGVDDVDAALAGLDGRRPVVVGGDGSLHLVVNRLLHLGLGGHPLGLVPLGTGNDLARGVGIELDPGAAARTAATGRPTPIAVARHPDGEAVVNNAHLGVGARAAAMAGGLKPRLGPAAYPTAALAAGVRPDPVPVVVHVDDAEVFAGDALALLVALGPSAGGGHELAPDADPTDLRLRVVVVETGPVRDRLGLAIDVLRRRDPADRDGVHEWTGRRVRVAVASTDPVEWDVDGEAREWAADVTLSIDPQRWTLVVPAD
ncbi:MAG: diacylglycerol/lipid kinase family protein [Acidimicrobiales bacterium]